MKIQSNSILAAVAGLTIATANAAIIQVSGYDVDTIAESGSVASAVTTGAFNVFVMATSSFTGNDANNSNGTALAIDINDIVTTQNGTEFFVDADASNTVKVGGSLTLTTPDQYQDLQFLMTGDGGDFTVTVNFSDASTAIFIQTGPAVDGTGSLDDWQNEGLHSAFIGADTSFVNRGSNDYFDRGLTVRELSYTLELADQAKTITSIDFDSPQGRNGVFGISGTSTIPEPSSAALLGLGGLALILRRRK